MTLPAILYVADLRKMLDGWDADRVRRFLVRNGLALVEKPKAKGEPERTYTTAALLADRMPEAHAAMEAKWAAVRAGAKFNPDDFDDLSEPED